MPTQTRRPRDGGWSAGGSSHAIRRGPRQRHGADARIEGCGHRAGRPRRAGSEPASKACPRWRGAGRTRFEPIVGGEGADVSLIIAGLTGRLRRVRHARSEQDSARRGLDPEHARRDGQPAAPLLEPHQDPVAARRGACGALRGEAPVAPRRSRLLPAGTCTGRSLARSPARRIWTVTSPDLGARSSSMAPGGRGEDPSIARHAGHGRAIRAGARDPGCGLTPPGGARRRSVAPGRGPAGDRGSPAERRDPPRPRRTRRRTP